MTDAAGRGPVLRSMLDTRSDDYRSNLDAMAALWDQVEAQLAAVPSIGGQRYVDRHRARGKMLVRERIEALVDPNSAFLELSPLAAWGTQDPIGAGTVCGIGVVEGVEVAISGTDMTYRGGSTNPTTLTKSARLYEISAQPPAGDHAHRVRRRRPAAAGRHLRAGRCRLQEPDPALAAWASRRSRSGSDRRPPAAPTSRA